ncbi:hypothetical protein BGZ70_006420 [Mortierella alpina]|uniref:N-acetyltransferase domain-containing protein n=1 Tax=Mortierella alpina TaxID=64518 RepID=A0A9P6M3S1_MORAP|nr:hypothetical protein BGZ70_006420 [Mortierella alpina]
MTLPSPPASVLIRRAQPEEDVQHLDEIFRIVNTAYRSNAGWTHESHLIKDNRISKEGISQLLNDKVKVLLLAFDSASGRVLGTAQLDPAECNPELDDYKGEGEKDGGSSTYTESLPKTQIVHLGLLSIDPEHQSRGLGRQLVEAAMNYAKETLERRQAVVTVLYQRPELSNWYKRLGFIDYGEKKSYPDPSSTLQDNVHFTVLRRAL